MGISWLYLTSASVQNGSVTVSLTGNHDVSAVEAGWSFDIGSTRAEILSGTAADDNGNSTLTLARPWTGSNVTGQAALIVPTSGALRAAIVAMNDTNDYAIDVHKTLAEIATLDKDVTIKDPTGTEHTFPSMPKNARLVEEALASAQNYANDTISTLNTETSAAIAAMGNSVESAIDTFMNGVGSSYYSDTKSGYVKKPEEFIETNTPNTIIDPNTAPIMVDGRLVEVTDQNIVLPSAPFASDTSRTETSLVTTGAVEKGDFVVVDQELVTNGTFDTDTSGWGVNESGGILTWFDGKAKIEATNSNIVLAQTITGFIVGASYEISYDVEPHIGASTAFDAYTDSFNNLLVSGGGLADGVTTRIRGKFTATSTSHLIFMGASSGVVVSGEYAYFSNISIRPTYEVYQAIENAPTATILANTMYFEPIEDGISRQDIAVHRVNKSTLAYDKYTFKGTKKFSAEEMTLKTPVMDYYFGASDSNGLWSDATYWYLPIAAFTRFNAGAYHPWFNEFGVRGFWVKYGGQANYDSPYGQWYMLDSTLVINETAQLFDFTQSSSYVQGQAHVSTYGGLGEIASNLSGRPDAALYNKVYLNQTLDLRLKAYTESKQDLLNDVSQQIEDGSYGNGIEGLVELIQAKAISNFVHTGGGLYIGSSARRYSYSTASTSDFFSSFADYLSDYDSYILQDDGNVVKVYSIQSDGFFVAEKDGYPSVSSTGKLVITKKSNNLFRNTMPHTDLIGDPANYPQSLKDRLASGKSIVGLNPHLVSQDGTDYVGSLVSAQEYTFSKKNTLDLSRVFTSDNGGTYSSSTSFPLKSNIENSITGTLGSNITDMYNYIAKTNSAIESQSGTTLSVLPKVFASNSHSIYKGGNAVYSSIGKVPVGNGTNGYEQKVLEDVGILVADITSDETTYPSITVGLKVYNKNPSQGEIGIYISDFFYNSGWNPSLENYASSGWRFNGFSITAPSHLSLTLDNEVSPTSKRFYALSELDNGLACLDMYSQEMISNAGVYDGDNAEFTQLSDGSLLDDNANTVITSVRSIPLNTFVGDK